MFAVGDAEYVSEVAPDIAESDVQVAEVPEYHWYVYGPVPVVGADIESVIDCPESIVGLVGVGAAEAARVGFTVTTSFEDSWVTGVDALSVTPMQ